MFGCPFISRKLPMKDIDPILNSGYFYRVLAMAHAKEHIAKQTECVARISFYCVQHLCFVNFNVEAMDKVTELAFNRSKCLDVLNRAQDYLLYVSVSFARRQCLQSISQRRVAFNLSSGYNGITPTSIPFC